MGRGCYLPPPKIEAIPFWIKYLGTLYSISIDACAFQIQIENSNRKLEICSREIIVVNERVTECD